MEDEQLMEIERTIDRNLVHYGRLDRMYHFRVRVQVDRLTFDVLMHLAKVSVEFFSLQYADDGDFLNDCYTTVESHLSAIFEIDPHGKSDIFQRNPLFAKELYDFWMFCRRKLH